MKTAVQTYLDKAAEADEDYESYESLIKENVAKATGPIFTTNVERLFTTYLLNLKASRRHHYNCRCCQKFIETYGSLATLDEYGNMDSLLFRGIAPTFFLKSHIAMSEAVINSKITGVFYSNEAVWGTPKSKTATNVVWTHLSGNPDSSLIFNDPLLTPSQKSAERLEEFKMLNRGIAKISITTLEQAVRVLKADAVTRSEKALGIAEWFLKLQKSVMKLKGKIRDNVIWYAVATAPPGFCHVKTTMINTLIKDIEDGYEFEEIKHRWASKMDPIKYMRPTVIKDGTIAKAEVIVKKLESEGSLARRYATMADIISFWRPESPLKDEVTGVFGHLKKKKAKPVQFDLPAVPMTWTKFLNEHLFTAQSIEFKLENVHGPFSALTTATNPNAPPIIQWDGLEGHDRNPVSSYVYHLGTGPYHWGLTGSWAKVKAICNMPHHWQEPTKFNNHVMGVFLVLDGARDSNYRNCSLALFPEILKSEYHSIRSVIEQYSLNGRISGYDKGDANGYAFTKGSTLPFTLKISNEDGTAQFKIDRWD